MVNVTKLQQRTARYEFADGVRDFFFAFWVMITGLYAWLVWDFSPAWLSFVEFARSQGTLFTITTTLILPIAIPVLISHIALRWINGTVRRRWLWRETGFIKAKSWIIPRVVLFTALMLAAVIMVAGILLAARLGDGWLMIRAIYLGVGAEFAYLYFMVGRQLEIPRYQLVAIIGGTGTLILFLLPTAAGLMCLLISLWWAGVLIVSGVYGMQQTIQQQRRLADGA